jgi:hypothetical protein
MLTVRESEILTKRGRSGQMTALPAAQPDYADLIAESPAAGFLSKAELPAAGIRRILGQA